MTLPLQIGLTGGIGTGKSTAAAEFRRHGAEIIVGDDLGRQALEGTPHLLEQVRARFGSDVFHADGSLNRRELGRRVFSDVPEARWLTELTFPPIWQLYRKAVSGSRSDVVVFDAAMIFEWGIEEEFDLVVLVTADIENVIKRVSVSGRLSETEVRSRINQQIPIALKMAEADCILLNDGTAVDLRTQIDRFWDERIEPELIRRRK
ncbi:MAG: dephospho-CoA kinase [Calditrichota bacterium]